MAYLILARKYRPQNFSDLIGQESISKILQAAVATDRVASAYLFSGPRGTGKTTTARLFAKAINCQKKSGGKSGKKSAESEPCNECASCTEITQGNSIDVMEIDAASHTGVDNIREVVINTVAFAPVRDRCKVFIIDEVHMLSSGSFNALLKTLEEPPPHVVFILCTTEFHKIPATIASRCQRFRFLPLTSKQIFSALRNVAAEEKITVEEDALSLLARTAAGSMRDALSLFDQVISHSFGEEKSAAGIIDLKKTEEALGAVSGDLLIRFLQNVADKDAQGALETIGRVLKEGYDLSHFLREIRESFREMLIEKSGYRDENALSRIQEKWPAERFSIHQLLRNSQLLTKCSEQMRYNDLPRLVFECTAVWLCQDSLSAGELMEKMEGKKKANFDSVTFNGSGSVPVTKKSDPVETEIPAAILNPSQSAVSDAPGFSDEPAEAAFNSPTGSEVALETQAYVPQPGLIDAWKKVLAEVHRSNPSLSHPLETATVQQSGAGEIELIFSKPLWVESVKKNLNALQEQLQTFAGKKISIALKVGTVQKSAAEAMPAKNLEGEPPLPSNAPDDDAGFEAAEEISDEEESAPVVASAVFESIRPKEVKAEQLEDEGLKHFIELFPGKLTRPPQTHPQPPS